MYKKLTANLQFGRLAKISTDWQNLVQKSSADRLVLIWLIFQSAILQVEQWVSGTFSKVAQISKLARRQTSQTISAAEMGHILLLYDLFWQLKQLLYDVCRRANMC